MHICYRQKGTTSRSLNLNYPNLFSSAQIFYFRYLALKLYINKCTCIGDSLRMYSCICKAMGKIEATVSVAREVVCEPLSEHR